MLIALVASWPTPARAGALGWILEFHASPDLRCDRLDAVLARDDWSEAGVDARALEASRALWLRLTPGADAHDVAVVARNQVSAQWDDYRDPTAPRRSSVRLAPASSAPGLLGVELPASTTGPVHLCLSDRSIQTSAVLPQAVGLMAAGEFRAAQRQGLAMLAAVVGVMLAMAALSLAFRVGIGERVFADYGIYVLCFAAYVLHSVDALAWLFPPALRDGPLVAVVARATMALMAIHGLRFTLAFTGMGEAWPRLSRTATVLAWTAFAAAATSSLGYLSGAGGRPMLLFGNVIFNASVGLMILAIVAPVVEQAWHGRREARIYLLGWLPPLLVIFAFILRYLDITPESMRPTAQMLMQAAAFESLVLGWGIAERARFYREARDEALHLAAHDPLTGALNRDAFAPVVAAALAGSEPASVLFIDVDHFKSINDRHGHGLGDLVLRRVVQRCQGQLRGVDALARVGGEEFVALLAAAGRDEAMRVAGRIRVAIGEDGGGPLPVTVSIGLAEKRPGDTPETWLARADEALYAAKASGRNRVTEAQ